MGDIYRAPPAVSPLVQPPAVGLPWTYPGPPSPESTPRPPPGGDADVGKRGRVVEDGRIRRGLSALPCRLDRARYAARSGHPRVGARIAVRNGKHTSKAAPAGPRRAPTPSSHHVQGIGMTLSGPVAGHLPRAHGGSSCPTGHYGAHPLPRRRPAAPLPRAAYPIPPPHSRRTTLYHYRVGHVRRLATSPGPAPPLAAAGRPPVEHTDQRAS